jgi:hypothetical protein
MTTLKSYLEAIDFKITGGSDFGWSCYGENARYLDCSDSEGSDGSYSVHAIFDSATQQVYAMEAWDYVNDREYRWIDPDFVKAHNREAHRRDFDHQESFDGRKFIEIEVAEDILEKISAIVAGDEYDTRIQVPVDLPEDVMFTLMKEAHEKDMTFNELMEDILKRAIERAKFGAALNDQTELVESLEDSLDLRDEYDFSDGRKGPVAAMKAKKKKGTK